MATVTTTTQTDPLAGPAATSIARVNGGIYEGQLFVLVRTAADTITLWRSTNAGISWGQYGGGFTHTSIAELSSLVVDHNGWGHIAYRVSTGTTDSIWYRRFSMANGSWSSAIRTSDDDANGGTPGSAWQAVDLAVRYMKTSSPYWLAVVAAHRTTVTKHGVQLMTINVSSTGVMTRNLALVANRDLLVTGTSPGRGGVTLEIEHNGDGQSSGTPNLWACWGRTTLRMAKIAWQGGTWSAPTSYVTVRSGLAAHDNATGQWDGVRWSMAVFDPDDGTRVRVYERNQANTSQTFLQTPAHPAGVVRQVSLSYDQATKNLRVYAVGTSTTVLHFIDYVRGTAAWTTWATVTATAVLGATGTEFNTRRGGTSGNARYDVMTAHSGAPNTIVHTAQTASTTPSTPTWNTSTQPYTNGGVADINAALTLDWDFYDADPGQTQGSYAVSRQIGAGALAYWRASDSTWQATEQQNAGGTSALTLAAGWGANADPAHVYRVKVWDSASVPSAAYSAALALVPSVKVNPALTAPAAGGTINTDTVTVTWTAAEQKTRRVRLLTNPGGLVVHDSGYETTDALSYTVPTRLDTGTGWTVELTTTNLENLASTPQTRSFTVAYAPPPAVTATAVPVPASGFINVTAAALAVVGAQPAIIGADLWRRPAVTPTLNTNAAMAGNVTGWTHGGGGTASTITYSTAQSYSSPGSARVVPAGTVAAPTLASTALTDVVAGNLYLGSGWIRPDTANKPLTMQLDWYTSASAYISSTVTTVAAPVAAAWQYVTVVGDPAAVPGAAKVRVAIGLSSTPAATDAFHADDVRLRVHNPTAGVRVAAGVLPGTVTPDWQATGGIPYEYQYVATGANGTSLASPWVE